MQEENLLIKKQRDSLQKKSIRGLSINLLTKTRMNLEFNDFLDTLIYINNTQRRDGYFHLNIYWSMLG